MSQSESQIQSQSQSVWPLFVLSGVLSLVAYFVFVLPAEFDRDPLGTGALFGIKGMSNETSVSALSTFSHAPHQDDIQFVLAPFESVEYKYELHSGDAMLFSWDAGSEVVFDLHSEETGSDPDDAISFAVGRASAQHGAYTAPYDGVHGWFWENRGTEEVTVKLTTQGSFEASITYRSAGEYRRDF